ncbi:Phenylalanyl-tRNA synthetase beta chain [Prochlorococcus marinus str. MIT 9321]|uniref:Phenylalanine--tRNA ligase beta subunit n=1 Tax=Prochlorococcus marinus str. MIT 9401 TaxID=167551 RepID=A0A0A2B1J8_PROMR|nr:phenylalanine--tRNA ligase subunit beta [Prochlorococcus marinus]KGG04193.1 Phenylalanyl-tRNA synthetase beta chain [Prochlorococcus marinus str. MIT 9321]KGG04337.1 Phenylalanyl-tRNA synthetase beta chain [Prochlorococcus marinus str. MIT 9322]KGG07017.1 Phenylalanyl-tRNA synthetase beta chain [Prochlorococcus marinus str. MIT 9401]
MKVSQNWLNNLVEITSTPEELSEKLSIGGFEVESLEDCSENVNGVVLGKVLSVLKHEGSDKLSICQVDIGSSNNLQIICGAPNIKSNIYVYVATIGAKLNAVNLTIKRSEIRGVMSEGMICSLQELGLEGSSEGIEIIDEDLALKHELGTPASNLLQLNDFIYDLAITANRPDGMSVIGIAREISALLESKLKFPELSRKYNIDLLKGIQLCPVAITSDCIYTLSCIDGVNGEKLSPQWLKNRIEKSGIKSINLLVDLTNYILLEQGQPLHAFDKDKLSNLIGKEVYPEDFSVRKGKDHESLICLDGKEYDLNENITVVTCCDIPVAIAGVIGGLETSVTNTTSSIYLEGAVFNPVTIRKSSKAVGIRTESSSRYEKGISSKNTIDAVTRAINLLEENFTINLPTINISNLIKNEDIFIKLRRNRIHKILGPLIINDQFEKRNLSDNEIVDKLTLIGCKLMNKEYGWDVAVIPNRSQDLIREIDLIEEIARLIGYDRFDLKLPNPIKPGKLSSEQLALRKVKNGFIENGFNEVLSYSLVPEDKENLVKISNPLLLETSCLRDNIWREHLEIVNRNIKAGQTSCYIFEIGNVFNKNTENIQEEVLNGVIFGNKKFGKWANSGKDNDLNYYQARGKLKEALSCLNIKIDDKPFDSIDFLHPGRTAKLFIEGKDAGYFGEIHPKLLLEKKSLKKVFLFSINVADLLGASTRKNKWIPIFKKYPIVPKIERDINFVFCKKFLISDITSQIRRTGKNLLEDVQLIDVFEDIKLGENNISYTFRLSYRDKDKTLLDSDIKSIHSSIISKIEKSFNTKLRD